MLYLWEENFHDGLFVLSINKSDKEKICLTCKNQLQNLDGKKDIEKIREAKEYFANYEHNYANSSFIKETILEMITQAEEKSAENSKRNSYAEMLNRLDNFTKNRDAVDYDTAKANLDYLMNNNLITTTYEFKGYEIKEYKGLVSGEVVLGTGVFSEMSTSFSDLFGIESEEFSSKLKVAKNAAIFKLVEEAAKVGGNAIIGVDFEYTTFSNNIIGVSVNGTAVKVEHCEYER